MKFFRTKFKNILLSVVLIPVGATDNFLDLQYKKIKPNTVTIDENIQITVNESASPLFYKMPEVKKLSLIEAGGKVEIQTEGKDPDDKDAYFQLGVVYAGKYRPGRFVRTFLPEWILKVIDLNVEYGLSEIDFHEVMRSRRKYEKSDSIRKIKLNFQSASYFKSDNSFELKVVPKDKEVLGFWLRADGDDSKSKFTLILDKLTYK